MADSMKLDDPLFNTVREQLHTKIGAGSDCSGVICIILGMVAIGVATLTTLISVVFLGTMLILGGIIVIFDAFKFWWRQWGGFTLHLLTGLLYLVIGALLIRHPVAGALSLTLFLATLFIIVGIFRIIESIANKFPMWGWYLFNGIVTLLLGILILVHWPASSLFIIGLFIGIDLIFLGWAYVMLGFSSRSTTATAKA